MPKKTFTLPDALPLAVVIKVPCSLFLIIYQEKSDFFMNYFSKGLLRKETNYANLLVIEFNSNTFLRTTYVFKDFDKWQLFTICFASKIRTYLFRKKVKLGNLKV